ncbi:MAG TPA: TolC family protein [Steroidobacteraceae bacterium]|nr:TolC family protein [Steroidobacteraceae bacterium]
MNGKNASLPARTALILYFLLNASFMGAAGAQDSVQPAAGDSTYQIDLATVLRLAGAQNLDVQLARNAVDEAHANYASAVERFLPSFVPSASYLQHSGRDQRVEGPLLDVSKHSDTEGAYLTAQIPVGDAIFTALQTHQLVAASDAGATAQERDSTLAAAQQYFDLVSAGALVNVVNEALIISQSYEQQLNEAVRIGIAFKGDASRVQTQTQRLQLDLTRARQQQRLAAARLVQTLHLEPLLELVPAEREPVPLALADLSASPQDLIRTALENRPELARSTAQISAAEQSRRGAIYGPLIPTIGGQAFAGEFNGGGDVKVNGVTANGGGLRQDYTVGLSWKIGPGGLFDFGRIRASDAKLSAAQLSDEKLRDQVRREVVDGYTQVQSLFEQLRVARLNLNSAEDTLRLTRHRKELGVGIVLEDIQAQQELLKARSEYVAIVTQLNQQQYGLMRSVGAPLRTP